METVIRPKPIPAKGSIEFIESRMRVEIKQLYTNIPMPRAKPLTHMGEPLKKAVWQEGRMPMNIAPAHGTTMAVKIVSKTPSPTSFALRTYKETRGNKQPPICITHQTVTKDAISTPEYLNGTTISAVGMNSKYIKTISAILPNQNSFRLALPLKLNTFFHKDLNAFHITPPVLFCYFLYFTISYIKKQPRAVVVSKKRQME